jgi:hypothetical protein
MTLARVAALAKRQPPKAIILPPGMPAPLHVPSMTWGKDL